MNVVFYSFTKRPNSTKQPNPSTGKNITCQLKEETSFLNPVLLISKDIVSGAFSPSLYNYVNIPYWQRYYYITDWNYQNGIWECSLAVDVMASFKSEIGNTSTYIVRSATEFDGDIIDTFYPATTQTAISRQQIWSDIYQTSVFDGCYIIGVINNSMWRFGAVTYYVLDNSQLSTLLSYLFSSNIYSNSNISEIGEGLYKSMFNPFQYIVSCMWFPYSPVKKTDSTVNITVGYWDSGVQGKLATTLIKEYGFKTGVPIAQHPQASSRGDYLNHAPYTTLTAYFPPFGEIPVDTSFLQYGNNNYLNGLIHVDFITGIADATFAITDGYGDKADVYKYFTQRQAQIGVPIQLAQVMSDYISSISSGISAVASGFTGNIAGVFSNIGNAIKESMPKVSSLGTNGSLLEVTEPALLVAEYRRLVDENRIEYGRPLCKIKKISTLSGFVQCGEDDNPFSATKTESEEINRNMKTGFFYE